MQKDELKMKLLTQGKRDEVFVHAASSPSITHSIHQWTVVFVPLPGTHCYSKVTRAVSWPLLSYPR